MITQIIGFDSKLKCDFEPSDIKQILNSTKYFSESSPKFNPLSSLIYDKEYCNKTSDKLIVIKSNIKLIEFISDSKKILEELKSDSTEDSLQLDNKFHSIKDILEKYCNEDISLILTFGSCEINSLRIDFTLNMVEVPDLIQIVSGTCKLVDEYFFESIKTDLENLIKKRSLSEHMTYSVISSTDVYFNPIFEEKEILGISWNNAGYKGINQNILEEISRNDVAIFENDHIIVTTQSVLMVLLGVAEENYLNYVTERICAVELFWRQTLLLKRIHFELDEFISELNGKIESDDLGKAITDIQEIQLTIQSELEVYRNTIISVTHSYSMLFNTLNKVLKLSTHYNFIQEKIETIKSIYESLNDGRRNKLNDKRNKLMENIQQLVILIGLVTIIVTILINVIFYNLFSVNQKLSIVFIIIGILILGFFFIFGDND